MNESPLWRSFAALAATRPRATAVIEAESGRTWTRRALAVAAERRSETLVAARGGALAFSALPSAEWMVTFLAAQRVGAAALPIDPGSAAADWLPQAERLGATHAFREDGIRALGARGSHRWRGIAAAKVTSGSTGEPTVIRCRAAHLLADGENVARTMGIGERDRNLAVLPLGHSYSLGNVVLPFVQRGTSMIVAGHYAPRQLLEWAARHSATVFPSVPVLLRVLAALEDVTWPRTLRRVISAGAPLPPAVATEFFARFGRRVHNFYGSSETGGICFDRSGTAASAGRSVGTPLSGVQVDLARGGRIRVRSAAVAAPGGSFVLPDVGEWNEDGELRLLGRVQRVANIGGRKVAPAELEQVAMALPGVRAVWVTIERSGDREALGAVVEASHAREDILRGLRENLPTWKLPRRLVVVEELPRGPRGKPDRAALERLLN